MLRPAKKGLPSNREFRASWLSLAWSSSWIVDGKTISTDMISYVYRSWSRQLCRYSSCPCPRMCLSKQTSHSWSEAFNPLYPSKFPMWLYRSLQAQRLSLRAPEEQMRNQRQTSTGFSVILDVGKSSSMVMTSLTVQTSRGEAIRSNILLTHNHLNKSLLLSNGIAYASQSNYYSKADMSSMSQAGILTHTNELHADNWRVFSSTISSALHNIQVQVFLLSHLRDLAQERLSQWPATQSLESPY